MSPAPRPSATDAIVVGSGPNGLAAAVTLAKHGLAVQVYEARERIGGGARTAELTEPGFLHDICSAVHPMAVASPFFREANLAREGLSWVEPPLPLAHPLDDGTAVALHRSIDKTAAGLDPPDQSPYAAMMRTLTTHAEELTTSISSPVPVPAHPLAMARMGLYVLRGGRAGLAAGAFRGERAQALLAALCAHSFQPLHRPTAGVMGLYLGLLAHHVGWPIPRGGAQQISDALASRLHALGGRIETGRPVMCMADVVHAHRVLLEVTPRQLLRIAADALPAGYRRRLGRYRYGAGVFKIDWSLDAPIPWHAEACRHAATVHLGGTCGAIAAAEQQVIRGQHPAEPFVLLTQPTRFDPSRAPAGKHVAWAYCHVPSGSTADMSDAIERQVERFAPGFRSLIRRRSVMNCATLEQHNPNCVGGDINGGAADMGQLLLRPVWRPHPWATPNPRLFLCSASTPPGGGVHGMCGDNAARLALRRWNRG